MVRTTSIIIVDIVLALAIGALARGKAGVTIKTDVEVKHKE